MLKKMADLSVLTLVKGRSEQLENLLWGLEQNAVLPKEVVIVRMNEPPTGVRKTYFHVKEIVLDTEEPLPLAAARNRAVAEAANERCIFLDVDCIPENLFVEKYLDGFERFPNALFVGPIRYLPKNTKLRSDGFSGDMESISVADAVRDLESHLRYELFWSLNFACSKSTFRQIGGFDEQFTGYGGEDTDFSFSARDIGVPLKYAPALAFHQYHPGYEPPLNHFLNIVRNASLFYAKWGVWPMKGWLEQFEQLGLIGWQAGKIEIKKQPDELMLQAALKTI